MFQTEAQLRLIQMCEICRIVTVAEAGEDPMKGAPRPHPHHRGLPGRGRRQQEGQDAEDFMN